MADLPTRDELAERYLAQLPYAPYPVQEDALLTWFTSEQGVLVSTPTGTGKTLIAQAALFEALHSNTVAYYTTPLIALTEQKFQEMQASAERWGFSRDDVGLVTGNRKVNPNARVLVVVAEILPNRLLHPEGFDFLNDLLVEIAKGDDASRKTPALVFAFNRDECWSVAEQLKGLDLLNPGQRTTLNATVDKLEWPTGVGPKLKQMLRRGVGVHHAGMLGKYRRMVEDLFNRKLLAVCVCTETLAAGINLPARSVVMTSLVKGPRGKQKLVDART